MKNINIKRKSFTSNFSFSKLNSLKITKETEFNIVKIKLEIKNPQYLSGRLPINEVMKAKSNSGIFFKQLFIYNSLKVELLSLILSKKNDLKIIPNSFSLVPNKYNN